MAEIYVRVGLTTVTMQIKPIYNRIDTLTRNLSPIQFALLGWLIAFSAGTLFLLAFLGATIITAATYAAGSATGATIVFYFAGIPDG